MTTPFSPLRDDDQTARQPFRFAGGESPEDRIREARCLAASIGTLDGFTSCTLDDWDRGANSFCLVAAIDLPERRADQGKVSMRKLTNAIRKQLANHRHTIIPPRRTYARFRDSRAFTGYEHRYIQVEIDFC